jgi:MoxR-like ATPase
MRTLSGDTLKQAIIEPAALRVMQALATQLDGVVAGKREVIEQVLIAMLCGGHALIEDIPGTGKTTLAHALATSLDTDFGRVQFTADLMPADIVGVEIFHPDEKRFVFHPGAVFHHILLADEINRATPKAQSALLEAMEERQVSIEGETHPLPEPFLVLATQNPMEHLGTFPLPESQLDRFFCRLKLGYPDRDAELRLLRGEVGRCKLRELTPVATVRDWIDARDAVRAVPLSDVLLDYVLQLLHKTRDGSWLQWGASPRAGSDLVAAARARAWLRGRPYVSAADVQAMWQPCLGHRVRAEGDTIAALDAILEQVPVPA